MHHLAVPLLLVAVLAGSVSAQEMSDAELAQVAAIRHELSLFKPGRHTPPRAFCVGVRAHVGDPSPAFLSALTGAYKRLVPLGKCEVECPRQDKAELQYPLPRLFKCGYVTAGDFWFEPEGQANLSINFLAGPLWGRLGVYKLRKVNDEWRIIEYELRAIS